MSIDTYREDCKTQTVLGHRFAKKPIVIETPIMISGMSYGALSKEAKIALAKATDIVGTSINNGEGGILPEEAANSYKQIIQICPSRFGFSLRSIELADALEIGAGIGAKPGLAGHLMGSKITEDIARMRQLPVGIDLHSHPRHSDIFGADDLVLKIKELRDVTDYQIPIFFKFAAGRVREDVKIAVKAGVDGVVIDGSQGGTGAAPGHGLGAFGHPHSARPDPGHPGPGGDGGQGRGLPDRGRRDQGRGPTWPRPWPWARTPWPWAPASWWPWAARVCLRCHEGKCAFGIGTQDPERRKRLNIDEAAQRVANYITAMTAEAVFAGQGLR